MDLGSINWLAVIVCVVVSMISGSLWYNPKTFFPAWWKVVGAGREQPGMENMGMTWGLTVLSSFVQAVAMAIMVNAMGITTAGAVQGSASCSGSDLSHPHIWSTNCLQVTA